MSEAEYLRRNLPGDKRSKQFRDSVKKIDIIDTYIRYGVWIDNKAYRDLFNDQRLSLSKSDFMALPNWTKFENGKYSGISWVSILLVIFTIVVPIFLLWSTKHVNMWAGFLSWSVVLIYCVMILLKARSVFRVNKIILNAINKD